MQENWQESGVYKKKKIHTSDKEGHTQTWVKFVQQQKVSMLATLNGNVTNEKSLPALSEASRSERLPKSGHFSS